MKFDYEHPELAEVDLGKFARGASIAPDYDGDTDDLGV